MDMGIPFHGSCPFVNGVQGYVQCWEYGVSAALFLAPAMIPVASRSSRDPARRAKSGCLTTGSHEG